MVLQPCRCGCSTSPPDGLTPLSQKTRKAHHVTAFLFLLLLLIVIVVVAIAIVIIITTIIITISIRTVATQSARLARWRDLPQAAG